MRRHALIPWLLLVSLTGGPGCGPTAKGPPRPATSDVSQALERAQVDSAKLQGDVSRYLQQAYVTMIGVASAIGDEATDPVVREASLQLKISTATATQMVALEPDPRRAFCYAWIIAVEARHRFTSGDAAAGFGKNQPRLVEVVKTIENGIVSIGRSTFGDEIITEAQPQVEKLAAESALSERFVAGIVPPGAVDLVETDSFGKILSVPLISGVNEIPHAINRATMVAAWAVQELPERTRWEMELLLPEVRQQVQTLIKDVDDSQDNIQATLRDARATAEQVNTTVQNAEKIAAQANETVVHVKEAAAAWESTAKAADQLVASVERLASTATDSPSGTPQIGEPVSTQEYLQAAADIREAATQINQALGRLESDELSGVVASLERLSQGTLADARGQVTSLVNLITVRAAMLIGLLLVGLLIYRVAASRLARPR